MILVFHDRDGDMVPVDAERIVGLESVTVKYEDDSRWTATLIKCSGASFAVAESIGVVYERWMAARGEQTTTTAPEVKAHPGAIGWEMHPALSGTDGGGL